MCVPHTSLGNAFHETGIPDVPMCEEPVTKKVTAIVACYRDAPAVPFMYERLKAVCAKIGVDYEIIFVNDCSPDNADEVLANFAARDPKVVVIRHSRNFGSQSAFTSGMRIATGDAVVLLDGDLQDPPELIESFYTRWQEGFDVVYGIRVKRDATRFLQIAYKAFYRVFRATSYIPMPLDAGDFSLLDRRVVDVLNSLPENNRFLRGLRAWVGFRQSGVSYVRPERMFGATTNSVLRNLGWARKGILSFSYAPIDLMIVLAAVVILAALLGVVLQILGRLMYPPVRSQWIHDVNCLDSVHGWCSASVFQYHRVVSRAHLRRGQATPILYCGLHFECPCQAQNGRP